MKKNGSVVLFLTIINNDKVNILKNKNFVVLKFCHITAFLICNLKNDHQCEKIYVDHIAAAVGIELQTYTATLLGLALQLATCNTVPDSFKRR